jgi:hypothetical protein
MSIGLTQRIAAGALAGVVAGTLAVGTLSAQAPAQAPALGAAPGIAPETIYGLWSVSPECGLEAWFIALSARVMIDSSGPRTSRTFVTYEAAPDGVVVSAVRTILHRDGRWQQEQGDLSGLVLRREGNTLQTVREINHSGEARPAVGREILHAC